MSFTIRVLLGLVLGLAGGLGISFCGSSVPWLYKMSSLFEPAGVIFINGIRMTVVPLVASSLIVALASARDIRAVSRLGGQALWWFLVSLFVASVFSAALGYPLLGVLAIDPAVAANLRASAATAAGAAAETAQQVPGISQWLVDLVPVNAFKSAVDGTLLPLVVFSIGLGLALTKVQVERQQAVIRFFHGISDAMLILVQWVLKLAPFGVFALAFPLAARMGLRAAGALIYYIVLLSLVSGAFIVFVLYPAARLLGGVPVSRFLRASGPAFAVAFSSRSSLAALPATIEGAKTGLGLPEEIYGFVLSLAASMFRVGGAIGQVVGALFVARLYGVDLAFPQVAIIVVTVVFTSLTAPGIPGGAIITIAPVLVAMHIPVEGMGVLLAVDTIPDMFRTSANVVSWLALGTILAPKGSARSLHRQDGKGKSAFT